MTERMFNWSEPAMQANLEGLQDTYPGQFIAMGVSQSGNFAVQVYAALGLGAFSRNRVLLSIPDASKTKEIIKTDIFDEKLAEGNDLSLSIYNAMKVCGPGPIQEYIHVVSNGSQTDVVVQEMQRELLAARLHSGKTKMVDVKPIFGKTLTSDTFVADEPKGRNKTSFQPNEPRFTPRITAYTLHDQSLFQYGWAITRRDRLTGTPMHSFGGGPLSSIPDGAGLALHAYDGKGNPPPSFAGDPYPIPLEGGTATEVAEEFWEEHLDKENRIAIAVKFINRISGSVQIKILNQLQPEVGSEATKRGMLTEAMLDDLIPIEETMSDEVAEAVDVERQALALRSGWSTLSLTDLEGLYQQGSGRKLPYTSV